MPVHKITLQDGTEGWRYGATGKIYTGPDARKKAEAQAAAVHASGWKEHKTAAAEYDDETVARARRFVAETLARARKRKLSAFVVTDGASGIANNDNPAVKAARDAHTQWELEHGSDPYEDWSKTASYAEFCKMAGGTGAEPTTADLTVDGKEYPNMTAAQKARNKAGYNLKLKPYKEFEPTKEYTLDRMQESDNGLVDEKGNAMYDALPRWSYEQMIDENGPGFIRDMLGGTFRACGYTDDDHSYVYNRFSYSPEAAARNTASLVGQAQFPHANQELFSKWWDEERGKAIDTRWQNIINSWPTSNAVQQYQKDGWIPAVYHPYMFTTPDIRKIDIFEPDSKAVAYFTDNNKGRSTSWNSDRLNITHLTGAKSNWGSLVSTGAEEAIGHPNGNYAYGRGRRTNILTDENLSADDLAARGMSYEASIGEFLRAVHLAKLYTPFQTRVNPETGETEYYKPEFNLDWLLHGDIPDSSTALPYELFNPAFYYDQKGKAHTPRSADLKEIKKVILEWMKAGKLSEEQLEYIDQLIRMADNRQQNTNEMVS